MRTGLIRTGDGGDRTPAIRLATTPRVEPVGAEVHGASGIGVTEAVAFLRSHFGSVDDVALVGQGEWSRCFGFRLGDQELVIRFGRHVEDFEKDRRAAAWASAALPVPEVHEIGPAFDGYFAISSRVDGAALESLDRAGWEAALPSLLAALDSMRSIDPPDGSGYGLWDGRGRAGHDTWRAFLLSVAEDRPDRRVHGWRARLAEWPEVDAAFGRGVECLRTVADAGEGQRHLVHADLLNHNVLVADGTISGVLDWGCALYGDPLFDVAWLQTWGPSLPPMDTVDVAGAALRHLDEMGADVDDCEARLRACRLHIALADLAYCTFVGRREVLAAGPLLLLPLLG